MLLLRQNIVLKKFLKLMKFSATQTNASSMILSGLLGLAMVLTVIILFPVVVLAAGGLIFLLLALVVVVASVLKIYKIFSNKVAGSEEEEIINENGRRVVQAKVVISKQR